jgi:SAM-dependent methyltransferase
MRYSSEWKPTKFSTAGGRLVGSRDPACLGISSRLYADLTAAYFQRFLSDHRSGDLIDLGCGTVPLYGLYGSQARSVTCVDWPSSLHDKTHIDVACDIGKPLPFASGSFDTVILSDVLEHIPSPDNLWKEIGRITRRGGKIFVSVPFFYWLHETPHDYYRYTEWALRRFAKDAGFEVLVLEAMGGSPEVLADILAKHAYKVPAIGPMAAAMIQGLARVFLSTTLGKRFSTQSSRTYPYGYFMVSLRS